MGGITNWQQEFSQLEDKVKDSQKEIKSLHQIIQQLEKRLQILEVNSEFSEVEIQPAVIFVLDYLYADYKVYEMKSLYDVTLH